MAKHWIKQAIKHPGALHRDLGVPEGQKIPEAKLDAAKHSENPTVAKRANLAATMEGFHHGGDHASKLYGKKRVRSG
jgi:hypothetical protein